MLRPLCVNTAQEDPYVILKKNEEGLSGNHRFEGFCVDLLREIADDVDFEYSFSIVRDRKYGAQVEGVGWNGMVRELIDNVCLQNLSPFQFFLPIVKAKIDSAFVISCIRIFCVQLITDVLI